MFSLIFFIKLLINLLYHLKLLIYRFFYCENPRTLNHLINAEQLQLTTATTRQSNKIQSKAYVINDRIKVFKESENVAAINKAMKNAKK